MTAVRADEPVEPWWEEPPKPHTPISLPRGNTVVWDELDFHVWRSGGETTPVRDFLATMAGPAPTVDDWENYFRAKSPGLSDDRYRDDAQAAFENAPPSDFMGITPSQESGIVSIDLGTETLFDLEAGAPPEQIIHPFLAPEGVTVLYARGGTGKGMMSVWFALRLIREKDWDVMVLDYEGHPREWARRARNMGYTDEELRRVHYRAPFGKSWNAQRGDLATIGHLIAEECRRLGVSYLFVDSFTTSTATGDALGGQAAAQEWFNAVQSIGIPALVIAHVAGGQGRFPDKPFGSVFVHNLARETWALERVGDGEDIEYDSETWKYQPRVMGLELRMMKKNDGEKQKPQFIDFAFHYDGHIEVAPGTSPIPRLSDVLYRILSEAGGPLAVKALAAAVKEDTGETKTEDTITKTLGREPARFTKAATKRPFVWTVKGPESA